MTSRSFVRLTLNAVLVFLAAGILGGCTSDPRYNQGVSWVQWNEEEKKRLQAQGFPQYNHD